MPYILRICPIGEIYGRKHGCYKIVSTAVPKLVCCIVLLVFLGIFKLDLMKVQELLSSILFSIGFNGDT